ncbi:MAG: type II secretion system F family protein [Fuerstiella sp.]|nr:type II secretion system F family protein [Fuerstiella sp.]
MDPIVMILIAAFLGIAALVVGIGMLIQSQSTSKTESRLAAFTGGDIGGAKIVDELMRDRFSTATGILSSLIKRFKRLPLFFQQAESPLKIEQFLVLCAGTAVLGTCITMIARAPVALCPVGGVVGFAIPWGWLAFKRSRRFSRFEKQLPDALDLMSRALRSGHSLASGLSVVATEMPAPISTEFHNCYEEQNLGIPLDKALLNMLDRIPNVDLQFFVTAVAIQRQSGGDLAEILSKISGLVRERFKILGQVKALTGEGRISGIVLMGLPPVLFMAVYYLNPDYVMVLFDHEDGRRMMTGAIILQIVGAFVIRKICDIKV